MAVNVNGLEEVEQPFRTKAHGVQQMVSVLRAEAAEHGLAHVSLTIAVGVFEMEQLGALGDVESSVAELDPAVHRAVQRELGLTPEEETRIQTTIGDARNEWLLDDSRVTPQASEITLIFDPDAYRVNTAFWSIWNLTLRENARVRAPRAP